MVTSRTSLPVEEAEVGVSPEAAVEEDTKVREVAEDVDMPTDDEAGDVDYGEIMREEIHSSHMIDHNYCVSSGNVYIYVRQY